MSSLLLISILVVAIIAVAAVGPLITRRMNVQANLWIAGGYLAVMLLLSAVCAFVPASALRLPLDPVKASDSYNNAALTIGARIKAGSFGAPEGFTQACKAFSAPSGAVALSVAPNLSGAVYVGTKGTDAPDDGKNTVDVYSYAFGHVVFSESYYGIPVSPPSASFENGTLSFNPAQEKTIDLFRFSDKNTLPQFLGTYRWSIGGGLHAFQLAVVLLPPGVEYIGDDALPLSSLTGPGVF